MEATDSQLSDVIRQGRMNRSPSDSNRTADDFSQNTKNAIENGEFLLPGLSQGEIEELEKTMKSPGMELVRKSIESKSMPPELKRKTRTNRIEMKVEEDSELAIKTEQRSANAIGKPFDIFNVSSDSQSDEHALLSQSFESNMTLTQRHIDSQDICYLRDRTPEEQEHHKQEKKREKARKSMQGSGEASGEPPVYTELPVQRPIVMPPHRIEPPHLGDQDIFADDFDDVPMPFVGPTVEQKVFEKNWMTLEVNMKNQKRTSDFVSYESHLWARMNVMVPIVIRWSINTLQKLTLRVRLVHYDKRTPMLTAIKDPNADVRKCRTHTEEEAVGFPPESFFYVHNSPIPWTHATKEDRLSNGFSFQTVVDACTNEVQFDLKFSCQEKCMELEEKRKMMCFVVFLVDENGNSLIHSSINEVRVVAYPRRDYKNYLDKATTHKPVPWEFSRSRQPQEVYQNRLPYPAPAADFQNCFQSNMHNLTNNPEYQMYPSSSSSSRKRQASDMSHASSSTMVSSCFSPPARSNDYSRRMALGSSYKLESVEQMDVYSNENEQGSSSKKSRATHTAFTHFWVTEDEIELLASKAREDRSNAARFHSIHPHPLAMQCQVRPNTAVQLWLTTFRRGGLNVPFEARGIHTMSELVRAFEINPNIFETFGLEPSEVHLLYDVFLNFHRIYKADQLIHEKSTHPQ